MAMTKHINLLKKTMLKNLNFYTTPRVGHLVHFANDVWHNVGRIKFIRNKIIKEFQILKGPLKLDNPILCKVNKY